MTELIFADGSEPNEPRTHVLIVGVGHYPAFKGGGRAADDDTLGQLTSPPLSARALADWFINTYNYPPAQLGSVALLISEKHARPYVMPDRRTQPKTPATYARFARAARSWAERGANPDSRLIFVFCGHGYGYGDSASLLMSDFDLRKMDCWDSALDLGAFIGGLEEIAATEQIFFIDACRTPHPTSLRATASHGRSPVQLRSENPREGLARRNAPVFFATGNSQPARGREHGVSVFTTAFLRSMGGMAARQDEGDWRINSLSLLEAMSHVSKRLTEETFASPQQPQGTEARMFELHHLVEDPVSPVYLTRPDGQACGPGILHYEVLGKAQQYPCTDEDTELEVLLPVGDYAFSLTDETDAIIGSASQKSQPTFRKKVLTP